MRVIRSRKNLDNINKLDLRIGDMGIAVCDDPTWSIERNPPMTSRLYYVIEGDTYVETPEKRHLLEPGKCYLIPSGYPFRTGLVSHMKIIYFYLRLHENNGLDALKICNGILEYTPDPKTVQVISSAITTDYLSAGLRIKCEVLDTLLKLLKYNGVELENKVYSPEVSAAIKYINSSLSIQLDVDEIASKALVSVSTLTKKFKNEIGMTVSAYIDNAIMAEASYLLQYSDLTVQQISERFGFCYQSYFTRRFKEHTWLTPQQYRNLRREP